MCLKIILSFLYLKHCVSDRLDRDYRTVEACLDMRLQALQHDCCADLPTFIQTVQLCHLRDMSVTAQRQGKADSPYQDVIGQILNPDTA